MSLFLAYCRPGFEADLAQEVVGYIPELCPEYVNGCGYVYGKNGASLEYDRLVFASQLIPNAFKVDNLPEYDRVTPLLDSLDKMSPMFLNDKLYSDVWVEYPDSEEGRRMAKFAKKIERPLRNMLKKRGYKQLFSRSDAGRIHFFFMDYQTAFVGISQPLESSPYHNGIIRLKFPSDAPSRSTLKLEEAFLRLLQPEEYDEWVQEGMRAVDLGASPGGWTYQLVKRGFFVSAVDHGKMDAALIQDEFVEHFEEDAFKFSPRKAVDWMVCDIVDQPKKNALLAAKWFSNRWCQHAVINLKLPMKKHLQAVHECLDLIESNAQIVKKGGVIRCKQLYHDRAEVTVLISRGGHAKGVI